MAIQLKNTRDIAVQGVKLLVYGAAGAGDRSHQSVSGHAGTGQQLPYFFDEVLALRVERDQDGKAQRALMCDSDGLWTAKDRSGKLDFWEAPDLGQVIEKLGGTV